VLSTTRTVILTESGSTLLSNKARARKLFKHAGFSCGMHYAVTLAYDVRLALNVEPGVREEVLALLDASKELTTRGTASITNTLRTLSIGGTMKSVIASSITADSIDHLIAATDRILACTDSPSYVRADDPATWDRLSAVLARFGVQADFECYRPVVLTPSHKP